MFTSDTPTTRPTGAPAETAGRAAAWDGVHERRGLRSLTLIDPVYVGRAVWNARALIAATTVLGLCLAAFLAMGTPKLYVATAQILMDPRDLKVVANEVTPNGLPSEATLALIESQTAVILSSNILSRVVAQAGLEEDAEFNGTRQTGLAALLPASLSGLLGSSESREGDRRNRTIARLRRALAVARETKSFVLNLSVGSSDPGKAARLANMTAAVFIDEQGRVQSDTARRATAALTSRLSELRQSVVETENNVEAYKSRNALIGVGGKLVDDEYLTRINDQLAKARGDITALRVRAESMRGASVDDVVRGSLPEEQTSQGLVRLRQTYSDLAQANAALATKLGPRHPQRIAGEGALASTRQAIAAELRRIVSAAQTELARAEETEQNLTAQIDALKTKQVTTSGSFVKLRELEREVDASRAVYEAYLQRARETSEQENLNTANVRVISDATPPLQTSGLSRKVAVAAGGIAGFLGGIALAASLAVTRLLKPFLVADRRGGSRAPETRPAAVAPQEDRRPQPSPPLPLRAPVQAAAQAVAPPPAPRSNLKGTSAAGAMPAGAGALLPWNGWAAAAKRGPADLPPAATPAPARAEAPEPPRGGILAGANARRSAEPLRSFDVGTPEREDLRARVRAMAAAEERPAAGPARRPALADADVALLRTEIETVKTVIADLRRRRAGPSSS